MHGQLIPPSQTSVYRWKMPEIQTNMPHSMYVTVPYVVFRLERCRNSNRCRFSACSCTHAISSPKFSEYRLVGNTMPNLTVESLGSFCLPDGASYFDWKDARTSNQCRLSAGLRIHAISALNVSERSRQQIA
jgi:hypothetical protein